VLASGLKTYFMARKGCLRGQAENRDKLRVHHLDGRLVDCGDWRCAGSMDDWTWLSRTGFACEVDALRIFLFSARNLGASRGHLSCTIPRPFAIVCSRICVDRKVKRMLE
jgi:hypothetical protein